MYHEVIDVVYLLPQMYKSDFCSCEKSLNNVVLYVHVCKISLVGFDLSAVNVNAIYLLYPNLFQNLFSILINRMSFCHITVHNSQFDFKILSKYGAIS